VIGDWEKVGGKRLVVQQDIFCEIEKGVGGKKLLVVGGTGF
jgi:hypothetical protein